NVRRTFRARAGPPEGSKPKRRSITRSKGAMTRRSRIAAAASRRSGGENTSKARRRVTLAPQESARVAGTNDQRPRFVDRADQQCLIAGKDRGGSSAAA